MKTKYFIIILLLLPFVFGEECKDTDEGFDPYKFGELTYTSWEDGKFKDYCDSNEMLTEWYGLLHNYFRDL